MAAPAEQVAKMSLDKSSKGDEAKSKKKQQQKPQGKKQQAAKKDDAANADTKGITVKKEDDLGMWYQQVLLKSKMIAYYDVSGCYILLSPSKSIWNRIHAWFQERIESIGVEDTYFPIFISEDNLQREKDHIEGFAAEVAWVTHGGKSKLEKPVAVRPTSETAMYGYFHDAIQSHRDLPLKFNQWNNVVRWEFKNPVPFLRTREFLWQEGHTAHLTKEECDETVLQILEWYAGIYEELLAVPVVKGRKTANEQFPGSLYTTTIEGFIPANGRGIQAGTSHQLGQKFAHMFSLSVEDPNWKGEGEKQKLFVWQSSWGFTTRSIGVMVLTHGDNKGLVLPPRVAQHQVVVIPVGITAKTTNEQRDSLVAKAKEIADKIRAAKVWDAKIRVFLDDREYSPGWKFAENEKNGIPLRVEIGPRDIANGVVSTARRDREEKGQIKMESVGEDIAALLLKIQDDMYKKADQEYAEHRKTITKWDDFVPALDAKNVCLIPHCLGGECEDKIKEISARQKDDGEVVDVRAPSMGAKSLCIPFEQKDLAEGTKCICPECDQNAQKWVLFGRSY